MATNHPTALQDMGCYDRTPPCAYNRERRSLVTYLGSKCFYENVNTGERLSALVAQDFNSKYITLLNGMHFDKVTRLSIKPRGIYRIYSITKPKPRFERLAYVQHY